MLENYVDFSSNAQLVIVVVVAILIVSSIEGSNLLLKMLPIFFRSMRHAFNYK
jgi:hypothetical protein